MADAPLRNISNLTFFLNEGQSQAARGPNRAARERFLTGRAGAGWENYQVHGPGPKHFEFYGPGRRGPLFSTGYNALVGLKILGHLKSIRSFL
jgi:hypothetical protein